ncbi:MAG: protein kinase [bacterium]
MLETIGPYKILRQIGKGGMGVVYKAIDKRTHKELALKVIPPDMLSQEVVIRFNREAKGMSLLNHPDIIKLYDYGSYEGYHYLAMEYIDGETLYSFIKKNGPIPYHVTVSIATKIAEGLAYIHKEGLIHRDIKSPNIMLIQKDQIKIMDFGLAQIQGMTRITMPGGAVGTAEYMSPEQIYSGEVDLRSDIYSLGVVMYEMLTGQLPFKDGNVKNLLMKQRFEVPQLITHLQPRVPLKLEGIVLNAMCKNLADRYQRVEDLIQDLLSFEVAYESKKSGIIHQILKKDELKKGLTSFFKKNRPQKRSKIQSSRTNSQIFKREYLLCLTLTTTIIFLGYTYKNDIILSGYTSKRVLNDYLVKIKNIIKSYRHQQKDTNIPDEDKNDLTNATNEMLLRYRQADAYLIKGDQLLQKKDYLSAIKEYENALTQRPDYINIYWKMVVVYEELGDQEKAISLLKEYLVYDPTSKNANLVKKKIEQLRAVGVKNESSD